MKNGFGIIEAIFSMAIMMIVMLGTYQMMSYQSKVVKGFELSFAWLETTMSMYQTLMPITSCTPSLVGQPFIPGGTSAIVYKDQSGFILTYGTIYQGIRISLMQLQWLATIAPTQYLANVVVQGQKQGAFVGVPIVNKSIPVRVDSIAGVVVDCY